MRDPSEIAPETASEAPGAILQVKGYLRGGSSPEGPQRSVRGQSGPSGAGNLYVTSCRLRWLPRTPRAEYDVSGVATFAPVLFDSLLL